jgi:hypothetical protein
MQLACRRDASAEGGAWLSTLNPGLEQSSDSQRLKGTSGDGGCGHAKRDSVGSDGLLER